MRRYRRTQTTTLALFGLGPHGVVDAQALWNDPDLLEIPAKTADELRFLVIGCGDAEGRLYSNHLSHLFPN